MCEQRLGVSGHVAVVRTLVGRSVRAHMRLIACRVDSQGITGASARGMIQPLSALYLLGHRRSMLL